MRVPSLLALLVLGLLFGCDRLSSLFGRDEDAVRQAYQSYREAMVSSNLAKLKTLVARDRARELEAPNAAELLQMASALYPEGTQVASVELSGRDATLQLTGRMEGGTAKGSVRLVKEDGAWKVSKEDWQIQISIGAAAAAPVPQEPQLPSNAVRPADYATLLGRWQGAEGGAHEWTLTFGHGYTVTGQHASGAHYSGQAAIFWDLGATSDGIRVPPGWSVLDVLVAEASEPRHVGQVSLGTFSKQGDMLKFCGSEPGAHVRTPSFEAPPAGVRCLTLARVGDVEAAPAPAAVSAPAARVVAREENDGASGQAEVVLDGVPQTYPLFGGFVSDTRFADPRRATIQFKPPAWGSVSGLRLTLDATMTGRHFADGKAIQDMMFNGGNVQVGQDDGRGRAAVLQWIAEGGQVFPPKDGCAIEVTSPYTGQPDSVFEGSISGCTVHSAGIDRRLASVKFAMHGAPSR
jgi:hypothetical protein